VVTATWLTQSEFKLSSDIHVPATNARSILGSFERIGFTQKERAIELTGHEAGARFFILHQVSTQLRDLHPAGLSPDLFSASLPMWVGPRCSNAYSRPEGEVYNPTNNGQDGSRAVTGTAATRQAAQRSTILGNLQFIGRAASSQAAQNKPAPGAPES
jgi:hypothetical protein